MFSGEHGISGVTRRLILQLLLESEKLVVCVRGSGPLNNQRTPTIGTKNPAHPSYGVGHATQLLYVSVHSTLGEILKLIGSKFIYFVQSYITVNAIIMTVLCL